MKTRYTILCAFAVILALLFIACDFTHAWSTEWFFDETQHWKECINDGTKTAIADHIGYPCEVCGYPSGSPHTHSYSATWSFNATQHWKECTAGDGAKDSNSIANHSGGNICTVCGYDSSEPTVTFSNLTQNGNASTRTTTLTLTFSAAITGLSANDITLSGVTGVSKGTLSGAGPTYTLPISGFTAGGTLSATVTKTGYNISGSHTVTIYYPKTDSDSFVLGETGPGGGKIFYHDPAGFTVQMVNSTQDYIAHYLEAAPNDMPTVLAWASVGYISTNITGTGMTVCTGRKNTADILATDANAPAAKACDDYSNNGKTDWFLPSHEELNLLYVNSTSVGNMRTSQYWSSYEYDNTSARFQDFSNSQRLIGNKSDERWVRAIRAF
jgi:hypothetical protein